MSIDFADDRAVKRTIITIVDLVHECKRNNNERAEEMALRALRYLADAPAFQAQAEKALQELNGTVRREN